MALVVCHSVLKVGENPERRIKFSAEVFFSILIWDEHNIGSKLLKLIENRFLFFFV
jgi:hypothetical protein